MQNRAWPFWHNNSTATSVATCVIMQTLADLTNQRRRELLLFATGRNLSYFPALCPQLAICISGTDADRFDVC